MLAVGLRHKPMEDLKLTSLKRRRTVQCWSVCTNNLHSDLPPGNMHSIYIVGAQCTGKTTLVKQLEVDLKSWSRGNAVEEPETISEVARTILRKHSCTTDEIRSSPERSLALQKLILSAQVEKEDEALERSSWFLSDRSGIDPIVYAARYVGIRAAEDMQRSAGWLKLKGRMADSLIVVCEAGMTWLEDDGVRLMPQDHQDWIKMHELFCHMLNTVGLGYCVLPCSVPNIADRLQFVLTKWRGLNGGNPDDKGTGNAHVDS